MNTNRFKNMKNRILLLSILAYWINIFTFYSQTNPDEKQLKVSNHLKSYGNKMTELGFKGNPDYFYDCKINLNKFNELKECGIDLISLSRKIGEYNYKEYSLVSPCIVKGVIQKKTYDQKASSYYHTDYTIKVNECLKSDVTIGEFINVKTVTGVISQNKKDKYIIDDSEPRLYVGEEVILMLATIPQFVFDEKDQQGYTVNAKETDYILYDKLKYKSGYYLDAHKNIIGNSKDIELLIKRINTVNGKASNFEQIQF